jgi:hypothetical protein
MGNCYCSDLFNALEVHLGRQLRFARLRDVTSIAAFAVRHDPIQPPVWPQQSTGEEILVPGPHTHAGRRVEEPVNDFLTFF